jgi:hypothetical protein
MVVFRHGAILWAGSLLGQGWFLIAKGRNSPLRGARSVSGCL